MVIHNYHWLNSASRVPISTCSAPLVQKGERDNCLTLTYDPDLQSHASQGHGQMVQTGERPQTNGQMDATKRIIFPAMWSIIACHSNVPLATTK